MGRNAVIAMVFVTTIVCGCDFFRGLAGRPTSAEINEKRAAIEAARVEEAAREQARRDSVRLAEKAVADSVAALERLTALGIKMLPLSELGVVYGGLEPGYSIVVGSFKSLKNAERMAAEVADAGYVPSVLKFSNGMSAVAVESKTRIAEALASYEKVKSEKFCPEDAWILCNN